jgi:peptide deformylase
MMEIVKYGNPVLRERGARVVEFGEELAGLVESMIETMYDASGVGLAAQQVGVPLQVAVLDVREVEDRPSRMWVGGREVALEEAMPLVLVNPEIELGAEREVGIEGCLSFPEITADIPRSLRVRVRAVDQRGVPVEFESEGLLARAVQHEYDHLQGILFIDRMNAAAKVALAGRLKRLAKGG